MRNEQAEQMDALAFDLLMEIIILGKSDKPYKHLLPKLEDALRNSPAAKDLVQDMGQARENIKIWLDRSFEP